VIVKEFERIYHNAESLPVIQVMRGLVNGWVPHARSDELYLYAQDRETDHTEVLSDFWTRFDDKEWDGSDGPLKLSEDSRDQGLNEAGAAYRRACGWDFAPGLAGTWLLYCLPVSGTGTDEEMLFRSIVPGFLILYDEEGDGNYKWIGHMWTAKAARRKGIATALLKRARADFPVKDVQGPATDGGLAFLKARWPEQIG
jgi:GNAT superfamily N-acetyltransferase